MINDFFYRYSSAFSSLEPSEQRGFSFLKNICKACPRIQPFEQSNIFLNLVLTNSNFVVLFQCCFQEVLVWISVGHVLPPLLDSLRHHQSEVVHLELPLILSSQLIHSSTSFPWRLNDLTVFECFDRGYDPRLGRLYAWEPLSLWTDVVIWLRVGVSLVSHDLLPSSWKSAVEVPDRWTSANSHCVESWWSSSQMTDELIKNLSFYTHMRT